MSESVKVYELYPLPGGGFSNQTADYAGNTVAVAATSNEQAHALAQKRVWASDPGDPLGILWIYQKGETPDHRLFNGDRVYSNKVGVTHGAGKGAIVSWMREILA
jgi:hypothetical protein